MAYPSTEDKKERLSETAKSPGKSPVAKIGVLIALAVVFVAGEILLSRQEPIKQRPEIPAPQVKPEEPQRVPAPAVKAPKPEASVVAKPSELSPLKKITNSIGMEFVFIPAGSFTMGSSTGDNWEKPPHNAKISQSFYLQTTEVSLRQWNEVMGDKKSSSFETCGDDCPVVNVFWENIQRFIEKLNQLEKTKAYRLPSEAEWEYACRAGTTTEYSFGDDAGRLGDYAWFSGNSNEGTERVAGKEPNSWGLYDMHGNVWEWVEDDWHGSYEGAPADGRAWIDKPRGSNRVIRGGGWLDEAQRCRSASRGSNRPGDRSEDISFRLSRSVAPGP